MTDGKKPIGLWSAISIGIGAMIGAGIFSILGVAGQIAGSAIWVSFIAAGLVTFLSTYSFAKLGVKYPSAGGPAEYLVRGFGDNFLSGGFNILLWISYIFALALYARAFGAYATTFLSPGAPQIWVNIFGTAVIVVFTAVNFIGAQAVGRAERAIVAVKIGILLAFILVGAFFVQPCRLSPSLWPNGSSIFLGAAIVFIAYQGFGLITNAAADMDNPQETLPMALYLSVLIVICIYVAVSFMVVGNLPVAQIIGAGDTAIAQAAAPFLGSAGFKALAIAALFSTASGINATLYGSANVSFMLAKYRELPSVFERSVRRRSTEGLFITAGLTLIFVNAFNLSGIAVLSSAAILVIYVVVNVAHLRVYKATGAQPYLIGLTVVACLAFFGALVYYEAQASPLTLSALFIVLFSCFAGELIYRRPFLAS